MARAGSADRSSVNPGGGGSGRHAGLDLAVVTVGHDGSSRLLGAAAGGLCSLRLLACFLLFSQFLHLNVLLERLAQHLLVPLLTVNDVLENAVDFLEYLVGLAARVHTNQEILLGGFVSELSEPLLEA